MLSLYTIDRNWKGKQSDLFIPFVTNKLFTVKDVVENGNITLTPPPNTHKHKKEKKERERV